MAECVHMPHQHDAPDAVDLPAHNRAAQLAVAGRGLQLSKGSGREARRSDSDLRAAGPVSLEDRPARRLDPSPSAAAHVRTPTRTRPHLDI